MQKLAAISSISLELNFKQKLGASNVFYGN